jgi:hypothetical protein
LAHWTPGIFTPVHRENWRRKGYTLDVESKETIELAINTGKAAADELIDRIASRPRAGSGDLPARAEANGEKLIDRAFGKLQALLAHLTDVRCN